MTGVVVKSDKNEAPILTPEKKEEVQKALDRAKIDLLYRSVFLSSISFELRHEIEYHPDIPTAATDGLSVYYNPDFFLKQDREQQTGLVAHEVWHVAFDHMGRLLDRDPDDWNKAADYVINNMLIKAGYQLPKGALYNPAWESLSSEEIYDIIHKEKPQDKDGVGKDLHKPGSLTDGYKKGTKADVAAAQNKISTNLNKAKTASAMSGKSAGDIPGEIQRHIEKLLNPVIPWNQYMTRFYCDVVKLDYTWKKPNKRYMPDFYLPSQGTPTIGNVVIAVDTSCSVSQKQLKEIYSEIDSLRQVYQPNCLTLLGADRKIQTIKHLYPHDELLGVKLGGGGGTSFIPVMEYCDEHQPAVLMYFTDLEAEHITDEPDYPTLWICYSKHKPQGIGETIYYKPEYAP